MRFRYTCTYNARHPGECEGQSGYGMIKLDGIMDRIIRYQLGKVKAASADKIIAEGHEKAIELARARCNIASKQIDEKQRELADYEAETIKVIRGQSKLSIDLLNDLVAKAKEEITELTAALTDAQEELEKCLAGAEAQKQEYAQLETWAAHKRKQTRQKANALAGLSALTLFLFVLFRLLQKDEGREGFFTGEVLFVVDLNHVRGDMGDLPALLQQ